MALRAVPDHPKFSDLKHRLGVKKCVALGCLEAIWHFCGRFTPQGNIGKYTDGSIEEWVEWPGGPGELIDALVKSCWLDEDAQHRLLVHDWPQHADKATKQALTRASLEFCVPTVHTPGAQSARTEHAVHTAGIQNVVLSALPVPVPEPVPVPAPVAVSAVANGTPRITGTSEFPLTIAEIRKHDSAVDETFVRGLTIRCVQHCMSNPAFPDYMLEKLTDKVFSRAVAESFATGPPKHRAGLLLSRVPSILVSWAEEERNGKV